MKTAGIQLAQSRYCSWTLGPNVGAMYRHGSLGKAKGYARSQSLQGSPNHESVRLLLA